MTPHLLAHLSQSMWTTNVVTNLMTYASKLLALRVALVYNFLPVSDPHFSGWFYQLFLDKNMWEHTSSAPRLNSAILRNLYGARVSSMRQVENVEGPLSS